jgi:LysM repeat protein
VNTKKKYRIKSRVRFFSFVLVMILLTVTATNTVLGLNNAEGQTKDQYTVIEVLYGDTIWDIAREHLSEDMDLRDAVHIIMSINNISAEDLQPGQTLKIPV